MAREFYKGRIIEVRTETPKPIIAIVFKFSRNRMRILLKKTFI
jgi:hypothetical protein